MKWNQWNPRWTSLLAVAVVCILGGGVQAAEQGNSESRRLPGILASLDSDKDGTLSDSEMDRAGKALKELDQDGDGRVAAEEIRRGRETRRPSDTEDGNRPQLRRQARPEASESADRGDQGGGRLRHGAEGQAIARERGPSGGRDAALRSDRPAREPRRESLRRRSEGDRPAGEMRRRELGSGPKRGARIDGDTERGDRRGGPSSLARRHESRRDGRGERCPDCGRPMPSGHRESGMSGRRGPGGRG
jgi:hypothetical protein